MTDNQQLRALFTLPPIKESAGTALAVPEMPPRQVVTGDREVDAVLWLQSVVETGNKALIDKALEAAKRIETPMEILAKRYTDHVSRATNGHFGAVLATFGFGELEEQARRAVKRVARQHEALSRFGTIDALFANTPAEEACLEALRRCKRGKYGGYADAAAMARFDKRPALTPLTIEDCLHVMDYWDRLYLLRDASVDRAGDPLDETSAHNHYCFSMMANLKPRNGAEAMRAFSRVIDDDGIERSAAPEILRNLITSGWKAACQEVEA